MVENASRKRKLFVGIDLDDATRAASVAVAETLRKTGFDAKYEAPEKLHVTLAFLGFVEASRRDEIVAALVSTVARCEPFALSLDKLGAFPHERRPRVVYVGAREQGARFRMLAAKVRDAYTKLGFEFRNDPVAHVTIARLKEPARPVPLVEFRAIPLEIRALVLFESLSEPARATSHYERLASFDFAPCDRSARDEA